VDEISLTKCESVLSTLSCIRNTEDEKGGKERGRKEGIKRNWRQDEEKANEEEYNKKKERKLKESCPCC
jgi:hypothetical protein